MIRNLLTVCFFVFCVCFVFVYLSICLSFICSVHPAKPIGYYAVDESPSYLVWYAVEAFPGELKSSLNPK